MNSLPTIRQVLDWACGLDRAQREWKEQTRRREERFRADILREDARYRTSVAAVDQRLADALATEEASLQAKLAGARTMHDARVSTLRRATLASRQQHDRRIEDETGECMRLIQMRREQWDRDFPAEQAEADRRHEAIAAALQNGHEELAAVARDLHRMFRGYRALLARALAPGDLPRPDRAQEPEPFRARMETHLARAKSEREALRSLWLLRLFRLLPPDVMAALLVLAHAAAALILWLIGSDSTHLWATGASLAAALLLAGILYRQGRRRAGPAAARIGRELALAARFHDVGSEKAAMRHHLEQKRIGTRYAERFALLDAEWKQATEKAESWRLLGPLELRRKAERAQQRNARLLQARIRRAEDAHARRTSDLEDDSRRERERLKRENDAARTDQRSAWHADAEALAERRDEALKPFRASMTAAAREVERRFPDWSAPEWDAWSPPKEMARGVPFATLQRPEASAPLLLAFPEQGSVLFEAREPAREHSAPVMNQLMLRLLASNPPGTLRFTIIDPVELGQNFAGIMHLADYEETLVNGRIWTQPAHIEKQLSDITEHIEKVIQTYLRNEYRTLAEYNEQAGEIGERYRFLVISDFPAGFSDLAIDRLLGIAASGGRCGVHTILHWDQRQPSPGDGLLQTLRKNGVVLRWSDGAFRLDGAPPIDMDIIPDRPPDTETVNRLLHQIGQASIGSTRVSVAFAHVIPAEDERWSRETETGLRVAIGRTGATKLQFLSLGEDTRQHALVAGKTGSGKSTLFHVLITNLALWCSPDQVEFYLVDFKKGVEFKCYAAHRLPHARVVAIQSDREFGLSVLRRIDGELMRRGDWFRELGVQDIQGYRKAGGREPLPRTLLIVDEFQEFFVEDDGVAQQAALLLDRLVRQGRAFGIHVVLGSQTLGGTYSLARTTLGQMGVRVALQCNEADAALIMDEDNPAPRLLMRPGEAIYNDAAGKVEGNSPFQVVWLSDTERDRHLRAIRQMAGQGAWSHFEPIVFEGNAPAAIEENRPLRALLESPAPATAEPARVWLGAPHSIKGPTEAVFRRQGGGHLLIVGPRDETALTTLAIALLTLSAHYRPGGVRFVLLDGTPPGSGPRESLDRIAKAIPHHLSRAGPDTMDAVLQELAADLEARERDDEGRNQPDVYLLIDGLHRFRRLEYEEDFGFSDRDEAQANPALHLDRILCDGARLGLHVIASCDSAANVGRFLRRRALDEFAMRMLFQMSANDSAALMDSTAAVELGPFRALFCDMREGYTEVFRPYARPNHAWIEQATRTFHRRA